MKLTDALLVAALIEHEAEELHDLKPGEKSEIPQTLKVKVAGSRWIVHFVLERGAGNV